jgi:capsular exopolysaccharide synthesis family protein
MAKFRAGLLNHAWKVLLLVAIGIACGIGFTSVPPSFVMSLPEPWNTFPPPSGYQSATSIFLNAAEPSNTVPYVRSAMQSQTVTPGVNTLVSTYTTYLKSDTFARRLIDELGLSVPPESIPLRIGTKLIPDTNIMELRVTWDSPTMSQLVADTAARILVTSVIRGGVAEEVRTTLRDQAAFTKQQIAAIQADMALMQRDTSLSPDQRATHLENLRSQLLTASDAYTRAVGSQATFPMAGLEGTAPGMTLDGARPGRFTPRPWLAVLIGAAAGLALGIGLVLFNEFLNPTVDVAGDLEDVLGAPVVSMVSAARRIPRVVWSGRGLPPARPDSSLGAVLSPTGRTAESIRRLRAQVEVSADRGTVRTVLVTSARRGEGRTTVAANLAVAMAQAGKRVILVDADLERPSLHRLVGVENSRGLVDLFGWQSQSGGLSTAQLVHGVPSVPNLYVLPSGPRPASESQSLSVALASDLVELLSSMADMVIFDAAPASLNADSLALASQLGGVLVVARARTTRREAVTELSECLALVQARVIGGVLNRASDLVGVSAGNHRRTATVSTPGQVSSA